MRSSRRLVAGLLVLLAGFAAGFFLIRRPARETPATPPAALARAPEDPAAADAPAPSPSPRRYEVHTRTVRDAVDPEAPQLRPLTATAAEDYRRRARFPRSSHPIEDGVDPIARDREVSPGRSMGPEGRDPTLVVYPARATFEAPQPAVVHAYLVQDGEKVEAGEIRGEVRNQEGLLLADLGFRDEGAEGDAEAQDRIYTAQLAPAPGRAHELKGAQLVEVHAKTLAGELRVATTGFLYSVPLARLTGRYRDSLEDGHLVIAAEVLVEARGRFHLEATLAAADGTPLAWAQNALPLEPGTAWIPLTYWGLALRERGVDGPYVLRSVALSTTGEMPNQKNDVAELAYTTRPYRAAQFSDRSFDDPDLLEAAERLEADAPFAATGLEAGTP
jgi:hypothetical protein